MISTPNRLYYTESRGPGGANPYHVHEFGFEEFRDALQSVFAHVTLFLENHVEGVTFQPDQSGDTVEARIEAGEPAPDEANFFVAVCAHRRQMGNPTFVYVPRAANVLREREKHIALLERELAAKDGWLEKAQADLAEFDRENRKLTGELEESNRWAEALNQDLAQRLARVEKLQEELAREQQHARGMAQGYAAKVASLEEENREKTRWALDTDARLTAEVRMQTEHLARAVEALRGIEKELEDRTAWAHRLQEEANRLEGLLAVFRSSRWVKLGRKVGLGPAV
jgi:septal ring factor EnvC (AmiA/AmiB activator)